MSKKKFTGTVIEALSNGMFLVYINDGENDFNTIGYISGKMRIHRIKVLLGDRVELEAHESNLERSRITRRLG